MTRDADPRLEATLGSPVAQHPRAAASFERLGLDYCCGGRRSLSAACRERGLDAEIVYALLESLADHPFQPGAAHDVASASITELCEHIVDSHHEPLRRDLPRISGLLDKVVRAHGEEDPSVHRLRRLFTDVRADLDAHMRIEEEDLFPACRALDDGDGEARFEARLLVQLEDTHASTGEALRGLRELGGGYRLEAAHCATHRVLLQALLDFELDLHRHSTRRTTFSSSGFAIGSPPI